MADWLAIAKDVITSMAVLLGGAWAAWKWGYGETLRKRREMPSPDGSLKATSMRVDETTTAVTLHAVWRNRGPLPIEPCAEHSGVKAFRLGNTRGKMHNRGAGPQRHFHCERELLWRPDSEAVDWPRRDECGSGP
jgi:hypothetical protein